MDLSELLRKFSETQVGATMGWEPWYEPYLCSLLPDTQAASIAADQHCGSQLMVPGTKYFIAKRLFLLQATQWPLGVSLYTDSSQPGRCHQEALRR